MKRIFFMLLSLMIMFGLCACGQNAPTWQEQYDLGVRYLSEGNYEEAIIAFTVAIEIDPNRAEAYVGRGDTYAEAAKLETDSSTAMELWEMAVTDYEYALELGGTQAGEKLEESRKTLQQLQAEEDAQLLLEALYARFEADDVEGSKDLMRQAVYQELAASLSDGFYYYDHDDGTGVAAYPNDFYYYGQWENGLRSGHGLWIRAVFEDNSDVESYTYEGAWINDLPNGEGNIVRNRYPDKIQIEPGYTTSVRAEITGTFSDGLYHGTIYEVWNMNDGDIHVWSPITAVDGVYQVIQTNGDRMIVAHAQGADLSDDGSVHAIQGFGNES